jgi:ribosomal protein S18 acetylase RimI-like enzyme
MEIQTVLYIYSFPTYLIGTPRVKIGRTSGSVEADPRDLALQRINTQVRTAHPEETQLLGAVTVPGEWIETSIHSQLKQKGYHIQEAPGVEWFRFPNHAELQNFLDKIYRAVILDDFSELGGGRQDIQGDSFESIIQAFGVNKLNGSLFKNETNLITIIDSELSPLYPGFPKWLGDTIKNTSSVFNVAYRDGNAVGVAIWKPKDNGTAKLSTLFVTEEYRNSGIGRNLLLTCLEQWKTEKIRRVFVTTAKTQLISFFERYGFRVEGIGREIYLRDGHEPEWFLSKLFFYESVDCDELNKARILFPSLVSTLDNPSGQMKVENIEIEVKNTQIILNDTDSRCIKVIDLHTWLNLIYPAESGFTPQTAYIIPIKPKYLIQIFQAGKTVYYGRPSCKNESMAGAAIVFYASSPISGIVATARIINRIIETPIQLYSKLGHKGVLEVNEIGQEEQQQQAIVFDRLIPFRQAISRGQLLNNNIINGHPQSMQRMSLENYTKVLELGGIYAG